MDKLVYLVNLKNIIIIYIMDLMKKIIEHTRSNKCKGRLG